MFSFCVQAKIRCTSRLALGIVRVSPKISDILWLRVISKDLKASPEIDLKKNSPNRSRLSQDILMGQIPHTLDTYITYNAAWYCLFLPSKCPICNTGFWLKVSSNISSPSWDDLDDITMTSWGLCYNIFMWNSVHCPFNSLIIIIIIIIHLSLTIDLRLHKTGWPVCHVWCEWWPWWPPRRTCVCHATVKGSSGCFPLVVC